MKAFKLWAANLALKLIILTGVVLLSFYVFYRFQFINFSPFLVVFSLILLLAEMHTMIHLYGMFYSLWPRKYIQYKKVNKNQNLQINIFICVCGEPTEILRETIMAAKKAADNYNNLINPKTKARVIVLNDGKVAKKDNWIEIQNLTRELGVGHIARTKPGGFKAGNINNALLKTPTSDPRNTLDIIFDADFAAEPEFLLEITKPFNDDTVDFVQSPQRYKNESTWVAKASAAHQIFFFDHICAAKGHDNALFLCGTNFAIRRSALDAVNGLDDRFITEDYATSLNLHLTGHKGVFLPKVIARGIAPSSLKHYFNQQQRWSKGNFDVTGSYFKELLFGNLTFKQKFHYLLSASYYLIGLRDLILMLAPLPYLLFGVSLIKANTMQFLLFIYAPLLAYNFVLYLVLFRHPIKSLVLDISSFPVFTFSFLSAVLKKELSFIVTIKKYEKENPFLVYRLQLLIMAILITSLVFASKTHLAFGGSLLNYFWAAFDTLVLGLGFYLIARENWNVATLENTIFKVKDGVNTSLRYPFTILPRTVYMLILVTTIAGLLATTPYFQSFAQGLGNSSKYTIRDAQEEILVPDQGAYYGYYLPDLNSHPLDAKTTLFANQKTSLVLFYQDWNPKSTFDPAFMDRLSQNKTIPVLTWEPWDTTRLLKEGIHQSEFDPALITSGRYDDYIRQFALDAKAWGKPFFLRFAHEMNGNWYPWGNKPEAYVAMWRHVHDIFTQVGADNVTWVWAPNNRDQFGQTESLLTYYPGDNYVDWVGFDGFNWGSDDKWKSFSEMAQGTYDELNRLNKPIIVAETSSVSKGGSKEKWFTDLLTSDLPRMKNIKGVVFYNENYQKADFKLSSGMDAEKVINNTINLNSYYLKNGLFKVTP